MIKGVIFDLDGTLIDSMDVWYRTDRLFLAENGVTRPPADISDRMKKMTVEQSAEYFIREFGLTCTKEHVIRRIEEIVRHEYEENIQLKPGAARLLDFLNSQSIPCGIATATYKSLAEAVLKRCGILNHFEFILTDSDYPMGKKFPDIFYGAAQLLGSRPDETLVLEDSLHCIETAAGAGFLTAGVYDPAAETDRSRITELSNVYFQSLDEVRPFLSSNLKN